MILFFKDKESKISPSPGYQINFDNLNLQREARHKTSNNTNARFDMVQIIAVQDRVNVETLDDSERNYTVSTANPKLWILTKTEYEKLQLTLQELVKRILCQQMQFFRENYSHLTTEHLPHKYAKEMKQKSNVVSFHDEIRCRIINYISI